MSHVDDVRAVLLKHALLNAIKHDGKAIANPVVNNVIAERPELRGKAKELYELAAQVVSEVNSWTQSQQREEVESHWPDLIVKRKEQSREKTLPPLPNVGRFQQVRTRFAPNPDGPLHLGNARPIILCKEYARMYNGHFILRYEDTSPEIKAPILEAYGWIIEDLEWLDAKPDEVYIQSDRLGIYYNYAEDLLLNGSAYVCTCKPEKFKEIYLAKKPCPCRHLVPGAQLERWRKMLDGSYKRGEAVMRIKTDITHPNPAIRDWPALRIRTTEHPRVGRKYRVWPLYNFSCAVDDHEMKISHIIRGKEHESNTIRQRYLYQHLSWEYPEIINVGRLGLESGILSKSKIRAGLEKGVYTGWDDPRLGTLTALRRRGIQPEAVRALMIEVGPKPINATLSLGNIASANRSIVEPKAPRYFFVASPILLEVKAVPQEFNPKLLLHPDKPEWGTRDYRITPQEGYCRFLISSDDQRLFGEGRVIRLIGVFNIKILEIGKKHVEAEYLSESRIEARSIGAPLIHWLLEGTGVPTKVIMPDSAIIEGLSEKYCMGLNPDTVIQFERVGFVRVDNLSEGSLVAYFAHR